MEKEVTSDRLSSEYYGSLRDFTMESHSKVFYRYGTGIEIFSYILLLISVY